MGTESGYKHSSKYIYFFMFWNSVGTNCVNDDRMQFLGKLFLYRFISFLYHHPEPDEGECNTGLLLFLIPRDPSPLNDRIQYLWSCNHSALLFIGDSRGRCAIWKLQYLMETTCMCTCWTGWFYLSGQKSLFSLKTCLRHFIVFYIQRDSSPRN